MTEMLAIAAKTFILKPAHAIIAVLSTVILAWWAASPHGMQVIATCSLAMWLLDTLSGSLLAARTGRWESKRFSAAISKLAVYGLAIGACIVFDMAFQIGYVLAMLGFAMIFVRESGSLLERLKQLGFPLPAIISDRLKQLEDAAELTVTEALETKTKSCESNTTTQKETTET